MCCMVGAPVSWGGWARGEASSVAGCSLREDKRGEGPVSSGLPAVPGSLTRAVCEWGGGGGLGVGGLGEWVLVCGYFHGLCA